MVEDGIKGVEAPQKVKTPSKRVSGIDCSESQNYAIAAAANLKSNQLKSLLDAIPKDPSNKVDEEVEVVNDGDAPAEPEGTAIGIERVEDVESFLPPTLPTILTKPGDKDVSPKSSPDVEVILTTPSPGEEEETPNKPAEDESIQNQSADSVTSEVEKHIVADKVDGVVTLKVPSPPKVPLNPYSYLFPKEPTPRV